MCRNWVTVPRVKCRHPNTILGVLLKECYPGLVQIDDEAVLATTLRHYEAKEDAEYGNKWQAVKTRFWVSFLESTQLNIGLVSFIVPRSII